MKSYVPLRPQVTIVEFRVQDLGFRVQGSPPHRSPPQSPTPIGDYFAPEGLLLGITGLGQKALKTWASTSLLSGNIRALHTKLSLVPVHILWLPKILQSLTPQA